MTPQQFVNKWKQARLSERAGAQEHFLDLCAMLGQPTPAEADPEGACYTFERGVSKTGGGRGWADVWMKDHFGWEYKGPHKDLDAAYRQLLLYREDLENPPLLVVCDLDRFEIHTNFTGTKKEVRRFDLDHLAEPANLDTLRKLFVDPASLKPGETARGITEQAAERFGLLADGMRMRGVAAGSAAHFLMKLMFCMFAEDIELLPAKLFSKVLVNAKDDPPRLAQRLAGLFQAMAAGGDFGADSILKFNGGLFADAEVVELRSGEIKELILANEYDWASVEPSIFGTLFERTLDPSKRSQIGAHYTSREDIVTLLDPVVMAPLRRQWAEVKAKCDGLWEKIKGGDGRARRTASKDSKPRKDHDKLLRDFIERLAEVTVLDPACGSGNFLYVAIHLLLDLEKEAIAYAASHGANVLPQVRPTQLHGIEINPYARELAQVVIWIGFLQWKRDNGLPAPRDPVLEPIDSIQCMDAILDLSDPEHPVEPEWPAADFIVGNPPFLGNKKLRQELGDDYVASLFALHGDSIPNGSDLCCYWFERAREAIENRNCCRAGLLATQGIRGGANRVSVERIKNSGDIFFAESDRPWILDGANVHVSIIGFDDGTENERFLDGKRVGAINANLTSATNVTGARRLTENANIGFMGITPSGPFVVTDGEARVMLVEPNPHGRPNSDVMRPWFNGIDVTRRTTDAWIVDLHGFEHETEAALYERPFRCLQERVTAARKDYRTGGKKFWRFERARPELRARLLGLPRLLATPCVSKHRLFVWLAPEVLCDHALVAFARTDDFFFGIVQSRAHEVWALKLGTRLETRPRYTPTTSFETFPFPDISEQQMAAVAAAAAELYKLRTAWLNPPEWTREEVLTFPGSVEGPWARYVESADSRGIGTVRYPRRAPRDAECAKQLAKRTLTNLYNQRPAWLDHAHRRLDEAVFAAYGWPADLTDDEILAKLLELNLAREPAR